MCNPIGNLWKHSHRFQHPPLCLHAIGYYASNIRRYYTIGHSMRQHFAANTQMPTNSQRLDLTPCPCSA